MVTPVYCGGASAGFLASRLLFDHSWRTLLIISGVLLILYVLVLCWMLPESTKYLASRANNAGKIAPIISAIAPQSVDTYTQFLMADQELRSNSTLALIISKPHVKVTVSLWAGFFMTLLVAYFFNGWLLVLMTDKGFSASQGSHGGRHVPGRRRFEHSTPGTRRWFNSTTGFGTLGYGLPAAIGARIGNSSKPVICLIGDGGLQFTLPELASAVEAQVGIIVLLWNNQGYEEIKRYMERRDITPIGVDIFTPNFITIALGFGCAAERAKDHEHLQELLKNAPPNKPLLVEIMQASPFHP